MVGKVKLEDGYYLVGPNGQIIRKLLDSEVAGVTLKELGFSEQQGVRSTALRFEEGCIVTHDGQIVRPLTLPERADIELAETFHPGSGVDVLKEILRREQMAYRKTLIHFDLDGKGRPEIDGEGTFECGPWYIVKEKQ